VAAQSVRVVGATWREDFDGDDAVQARVARPVDLAHPAGADGCPDLVRPKACSRSERLGNLRAANGGER